MEVTTDVIEQPDSKNEWLVELHVKGSPVLFKIDTGADITVMSQTAFNRLARRPRLVMTGPKPLVTSPGGEVQCVGSSCHKSIQGTALQLLGDCYKGAVLT